VARTREERRTLVGNPERKRALGRPKRKLEENITWIFRRGRGSCIALVWLKTENNWQCALVKAVMNLSKKKEVKVKQSN